MRVTEILDQNIVMKKLVFLHEQVFVETNVQETEDLIIVMKIL